MPTVSDEVDLPELILAWMESRGAQCAESYEAFVRAVVLIVVDVATSRRPSRDFHIHLPTTIGDWWMLEVGEFDFNHGATTRAAQ
jgi:hypothetical protein